MNILKLKQRPKTFGRIFGIEPEKFNELLMFTHLLSAFSPSALSWEHENTSSSQPRPLPKGDGSAQIASSALFQETVVLASHWKNVWRFVRRHTPMEGRVESQRVKRPQSRILWPSCKTASAQRENGAKENPGRSRYSRFFWRRLDSQPNHRSDEIINGRVVPKPKRLASTTASGLLLSKTAETGCRT